MLTTEVTQARMGNGCDNTRKRNMLRQDTFCSLKLSDALILENECFKYILGLKK